MADGQTATNPQTGERLIMRGGRWEPVTPDRTPPPQPQGFRPVFTAPSDPMKAQGEVLRNTRTAQEISSQPLQDQATVATIDAKQRDARYAPLDQAGKLVDDYRQAQPVKDYMSALTNYASALQTQPNPQGDLSLIYNYAKIMDPGSVVREGEMNMATSTSPIVQQIQARFGKELANGGALSDTARKALRAEMANKMAQMNQAFIGERVNFKKKAERYGLNPLDVVGEHPGLRFQQIEANALGRPVPQLDYNGENMTGSVSPTTPSDPSGAFPGGIAFGDEPQPKTGYRMAPEKQAAYEAFVKSQLGNPNASVESINNFLTAIGEQPIPNDERAARFIESLKAGKISSGVDYSANDAAQRAEYERMMKEREGLIADPVIRGAADTVSMGMADEVGALFDTVGEGGTFQQNLYDQRLTDKADAEVNPNLRLGGQLAGALLLPSGIGKAAATGGVRAGAVRAAKEGAGFGAAYGFGSGEDAGGRASNALLGAVTGGAVGYGAGRAIPAVADTLGKVTSGTRNALMPNRAAEMTRRSVLAQAAERQGVDLLPADVGGAGLKGLTSAAAQAPVSAGSIQRAAQAGVEQLGDATARAGASVGKVLPPDQAGEIARKGVKAELETNRARISAMYEKVDRSIGRVRPKFQNAIAAIDAELANKAQAGGLADDISAELKKVRDALASGKITAVGLKEARKVLGPLARTERLRGTDAERVFKDVLNAAADDLEAALRSVGKDREATLLKRADTLWRERIEEIDTVFEPIIGKTKSGEDIVKAVESMTQGNRGGLKRLAGMMRRLPKDEAGDLQATILDRMGRARAGAQDSTGDVFSPETFLTNWNKMKDGRSALFPDPQLRANLDDIALLASAKRDTGKFASRSNTPIGIAGNLGALGGTGGLAGAAAAGPAGALFGTALTGMGQFGLGKLLASKSFTSWLARSPRNATPAAQKAYVQRLEQVAAREPAISGNVIQLKDYLANRIAQSPQQAAADVGGNQQDGGQKPPQ